MSWNYIRDAHRSLGKDYPEKPPLSFFINKNQTFTISGGFNRMITGIICPNCELNSFNPQKLYCYNCYLYSVPRIKPIEKGMNTSHYWYFQEGSYSKGIDFKKIQNTIDTTLDLEEVKIGRYIHGERECGELIWKDGEFLIDKDDPLFEWDWRTSTPIICLKVNDKWSDLFVPVQTKIFEKIIPLQCKSCGFLLSYAKNKIEGKSFLWCWECDTKYYPEELREEIADSKIQSPIEEKFWEIAKKEFPLMKPQYKIGDYHVDFALPDIKIAIELEGHEYHSTKEQLEYDANREREVQKIGWRIIRFRGGEVYKNVNKCIQDVKQIIEANSEEDDD